MSFGQGQRSQSMSKICRINFLLSTKYFLTYNLHIWCQLTTGQGELLNLSFADLGSRLKVTAKVKYLACFGYKIRTMQWIQFKLTTIIASIMKNNYLDFEKILHRTLFYDLVFSFAGFRSHSLDPRSTSCFCFQ